jgi:hypothetical protein
MVAPYHLEGGKKMGPQLPSAQFPIQEWLQRHAMEASLKSRKRPASTSPSTEERPDRDHQAPPRKPVSTFGRLVIQALEHPESVDRNRLLEAADAFLNAAPDDFDSAGLVFAKGMAFRACDWAVFSTPENYNALTRAVRRLPNENGP